MYNQFLNEVILLSKCDHKYIIKLYGLIQCDEQTFGLITDYFMGKNLYKYKTQ